MDKLHQDGLVKTLAERGQQKTTLYFDPLLSRLYLCQGYFYSALVIPFGAMMFCVRVTLKCCCGE